MKRLLLTASVVLLLGIGSYIYFKVWYEVEFTDFATEITIALLGSVITVAITAVLLQAQVVHEVSRDKSVGVFQEKLALYKEFVEFLNAIVADDQIAQKELVEMRGWALKLSLVASWALVAEINHFISQTMKFKKHRFADLTEDEKKAWVVWYRKIMHLPPDAQVVGGENPPFMTFGRIVASLKEDLGEASLCNDVELQAIWGTIDQLLDDDVIDETADQVAHD